VCSILCLSFEVFVIKSVAMGELPGLHTGGIYGVGLKFLLRQEVCDA
jgi:hypothetical protein